MVPDIVAETVDVHVELPDDVPVDEDDAVGVAVWVDESVCTKTYK